MHPIHKRQGQMDIQQVYFYTQTIQGFKQLLSDDDFKLIIINSLRYLASNNFVTIHGFVIMPNHIHLLWKYEKQNSKESSAASFAKFTAHQFKKILAMKNPELLSQFATGKKDRTYLFWKRDPLAVPITNEKSFIQKLEYIHANPTKDKWKLSSAPEDYYWSSARFYMYGTSEFEFLRHYLD